MHLLRILPKVLFLSLLAAPALAFPLTPYRAEYTVHADGFKVGEMQREFSRQDDGDWVLENTLYTTGVVALFKKDRLTERSVLRTEGDDVRPLSYLYTYRGRNKDVVERLTFDWANGEVASQRDGRITRLRLKPGIYDKLAHQVALLRDLSRGQTHMEYRVADRSKIDTYTFDVVGHEKLTTSVGTFDTVKVKKGTTMLWVAPELDYLVVQIVQKEDHTLSSYITALKRPRTSATTVTAEQSASTASR